MTGFRPRIKTKEIVCDWDGLAPDEGAEPLSATLRVGLTLAELSNVTAAPPIRIDGTTMITTNSEALRTAIAPYILAWNVEGRNSETGEYELLPPPAEAGPDVLRVCDSLIASWLSVELIAAHFGGQDRPKEVTPSEPTDEPSPLPEAPEPPAGSEPVKHRPSRRRGSSPISAST